MLSQSKEQKELMLKEKAEIGRSTWRLLHGIARRYPDSPTRQEKQAVRDLLGSLHIIYPCKPCASAFSLFKNSPILDTTSRSSLIFSMCTFHNFVNSKLGKPLTDCSVYTAAQMGPLARSSPPGIIKRLHYAALSIIQNIKMSYR
ncbi:mitochondrial FAD-linked sulfhydryl oxidase [Nematocida ausubeli]|nr:mitochondrial FAD-linked sulfhydryl oxidase [Nematocida ausubeli]KAI5146682.1 mitochondrial FAD-linked sulfhydryl oxidase [Nematocida ausubeli]KAI5161278.1 mitochondrial FAD-linked sulfhydryl oxidase [Nematocida ausubeli]